MTTPIADLELYNARMSHAVLDKAFFAWRLPDVDVFVDYGCADATLIQHISTFYPDRQYIGYDNDKNMLDIAARNVPGAFFMSDLRNIEKVIRGRKSALILSSVVHEIYAYGNPFTFWEWVFTAGFKYIVVRDMAVEPSFRAETIPQAEIAAVCSQLVLDGKYNLVEEFEAEYGSIHFRKNFIHFLLKYKYENNWSRELQENYLPMNSEEYLTIFTSPYNKVKLHYFDHYTLPFLRQQIHNDFGFQFNEKTHIKIIAELV